MATLKKQNVHSDLLGDRVIFKVSFKRTFLSKRGLFTLIFSLLFALYPFIGLYQTLFNNDTIFHEGAMYSFHSFFSFMYELVIIPLIIALFASYIITEDIDDKTITYWIVRPIRRSEIYLSKLLALVVGSFLIALIIESVNFLLFYIIAKVRREFIDLRLFLFHLIIIFIIVLYYSTATSIISLIFPFSTLTSILYIALWELATYGALMDLGAKGIKWIFIHNYIVQIQNATANIVFGFHYTIDMSIFSIVILFIILFTILSSLFIYLSKRKEYP